MRESKIEEYLRSRVAEIGGKCIKMVPTYEAGIPDRLVLLNGESFFVELKAPGKKACALQIQYMKELRASGFQTFVIDSLSGVDEFVRAVGRTYVVESIHAAPGNSASGEVYALTFRNTDPMAYRRTSGVRAYKRTISVRARNMPDPGRLYTELEIAKMGV